MTSQAILGDVIHKARLKQGEVEITHSSRGGISFEVKQIPLDYYYRRGLLNIHEYNAANSLFCDFYLSGQTTAKTIKYGDHPLGVNKAYLGHTEIQLNALERWRNALEYVKGQIGRQMVINICCYGYKIKDAYSKSSAVMQNAPVMSYFPYKTPQQAMARFHEALDDLIEFYELTRNS